jgi:two-component system sensor histidine kinase/response regulator
MMPDMDGLTLVEHINQHPELAVATLMMISSTGRREDAQRCWELGVSAYVAKPIRADLMDTILRVRSPSQEVAWQRSLFGGSYCLSAQAPGRGRPLDLQQPVSNRRV